jgi:hypothetical protein
MRIKDPDLKAIETCCRALEKCTSHDMLRTAILFITDKYIVHPPTDLPEHLKMFPNQTPS